MRVVLATNCTPPFGVALVIAARPKLLEEYGIEICCYIDTKNNKRQLDLEVYYFKDIPSPDEIFVLTYIKQMEAREQTKQFLTKKGFREGSNFMLVS